MAPGYPPFPRIHGIRNGERFITPAGFDSAEDGGRSGLFPDGANASIFPGFEGAAHDRRVPSPSPFTARQVLPIYYSGSCIEICVYYAGRI